MTFKNKNLYYSEVEIAITVMMKVFFNVNKMINYV